MTVETIPKKEKTSQKKPKITRPWQVILYNDDIHTIDEVILQVQKATGCSLMVATQITMEAHFKGKAIAYKGEFADCHQVAGILKEIGLIVEIQG
ncbi:MAG: ATP-dependent Clp protease adaptor ClpS [bacterium]